MTFPLFSKLQQPYHTTQGKVEDPFISPGLISNCAPFGSLYSSHTKLSFSHLSHLSILPLCATCILQFNFYKNTGVLSLSPFYRKETKVLSGSITHKGQRASIGIGFKLSGLPEAVSYYKSSQAVEKITEQE